MRDTAILHGVALAMRGLIARWKSEGVHYRGGSLLAFSRSFVSANLASFGEAPPKTQHSTKWFRGSNVKTEKGATSPGRGGTITAGKRLSEIERWESDMRTFLIASLLLYLLSPATAYAISHHGPRFGTIVGVPLIEGRAAYDAGPVRYHLDDVPPIG